MTHIEPTLPTPRSPAEETILAGGGEMGARMRAFDWAASLLGRVAGWPPSLRRAVSLCLHSQFPIVLFWGPDLVMLYNDAYLPILADKHPVALGRPARDVWPEIWSIVNPMLGGVLKTGQATWSYDLLLPIIHNSAVGEHYFTFSYSPILDDAGQVCGVFCPVTETTERLQGERREQLLRAEAEVARDRVTHLFDSMAEGFVAFDRQWRITAVNAAAARFPNKRREELLGKNYWEEFSAAWDTRAGSEFRRAMTERVAVEIEDRYPPLDRWYEIRAYPLNDGGLSLFFRDITKRKQIEAALRERELRYRLTARATNDALWDWDLITDEAHWTSALQSLFGYPATEVGPDATWWSDHMHPEDRERVVSGVRALIDSGE